MRPILAPDARPLLEDLARAAALLVFDFDGTLAPIVGDRDAARLRPETRGLLRALAVLYPCAILSGRGRADVAARVEGIPLVAIVGTHGAEPGFGPVDRALPERVARWRRALSAALEGEPGVDVEDKRFSLAIHYRNAPAPAAARRTALRAASALAGARSFGGRHVVNVVAAGAPDKASALLGLLRRTGARRALYAGDDLTDEDVFSRVDCVGVRVGRTHRSRASHYVPGQLAIDELLRALLTARTRLDGVGERWDTLVRAVASGGAVPCQRA